MKKKIMNTILNVLERKLKRYDNSTVSRLQTSTNGEFDIIKVYGKHKISFAKYTRIWYIVIKNVKKYFNNIRGAF